MDTIKLSRFQKKALLAIIASTGLREDLRRNYQSSELCQVWTSDHIRKFRIDELREIGLIRWEQVNGWVVTKPGMYALVKNSKQPKLA